jgi:hypothetical protein
MAWAINGGGELLGSRHHRHGTELGVSRRKVARQVMEDDADIRVAAGNRLQHVAVLVFAASWLIKASSAEMY